MKPGEQDLRTLFATRANRSGWADVDGMVERAMSHQPTPVLGKARLAIDAIGALTRGVLVLVVLAIVGFAVALQSGSRTPPTGLWQSEGPVGTGIVGSNTCLAVDLTDPAYKSGAVTVWWWAPDEGKTDCRTSSSGPMEAIAALESVQLGVRTAFRIQLDLELIGGGSESVVFTLDPSAVATDGVSLAGFAGEGPRGRALNFSLVHGLDVTPPGGVPAPTPHIDHPSD
jgi:hypothetical protein